MKAFTFVEAPDFETAAREAARPDAALKAGGTDLLDRMKERTAEPAHLVGISGIVPREKIRVDGSGMTLHALVTLTFLSEDPSVRRHYPALAEAAAGAATPQIRNMATLGGNICQRPRCWYFRLEEYECRKKGGADCFAFHGENQFHAIFHTEPCACVHPSATATALMAYGATVVTTAPGGGREVPLDQFLVLPDEDPTVETILKTGEVVTAVKLPPPHASVRSAYVKIKHKQTFDWPLADAAAVLRMDGRICREARLVLGAVAPVPMRRKAAEQFLAGRVVDASAARQAAEKALDDATPLAKNGYKVTLAKVALERAILAAGG
jgi:xanthine dehydrogenase YagS FAD-binding subunit